MVASSLSSSDPFQRLFQFGSRSEPDLRMISQGVIDYFGQLLGNRGISLANRDGVGLQHGSPGVLLFAEVAWRVWTRKRVLASGG
jgi:hypothetical protein